MLEENGCSQRRKLLNDLNADANIQLAIYSAPPVESLLPPCSHNPHSREFTLMFYRGFVWL